jgi:hypothetical protein
MLCGGGGGGGCLSLRSVRLLLSDQRRFATREDRRAVAVPRCARNTVGSDRGSDHTWTWASTSSQGR